MFAHQTNQPYAYESTSQSNGINRILEDGLHSERIDNDLTDSTFSKESGNKLYPTYFPLKVQQKSEELLINLNLQGFVRNRKGFIRSGFLSINKWEGMVTEVFNAGFKAVLTDLKHGGTQEEVELSKDEISEQDLTLLRPGALFYWNIGYETINGQRKKASLIRFKRLPNWSEKDWDRILDKANELQKGLEWE